MLELRPNCELCDKDLAPNAADARICTYECTYCAACVDGPLNNVCPNCGGGFTPRPIRPAKAWRKGLSVDDQPASTKRIHCRYNAEELAAFSASIQAIDPTER
ncbi:UNVERIFIED_CONTAM: hypothetical protein GTU68_026822 [Idotea baltica]|nr:hypothetical protein [Idotea baltica]